MCTFEEYTDGTKGADCNVDASRTNNSVRKHPRQAGPIASWLKHFQPQGGGPLPLDAAVSGSDSAQPPPDDQNLCSVILGIHGGLVT